MTHDRDAELVKDIALAMCSRKAVSRYDTLLEILAGIAVDHLRSRGLLVEPGMVSAARRAGIALGVEAAAEYLDARAADLLAEKARLESDGRTYSTNHVYADRLHREAVAIRALALDPAAIAAAAEEKQ